MDRTRSFGFPFKGVSLFSAFLLASVSFTGCSRAALQVNSKGQGQQPAANASSTGPTTEFGSSKQERQWGNEAFLESVSLAREQEQARHALEATSVPGATAEVSEMVRSFDALSYTLKGEVNWKSRGLEAELSLKFKLRDNTLSTIELDSAIPEIRAVDLIKSTDGQAREGSTALEFSQDTKLRKLSIALPEALKKPVGESYFLRIRYFVARGGQFALVEPRSTDPIKSRVAYTTSEPLGAAFWMPCHNTPRDRAQFATEFKMPVSESLVANGDLRSNKTVGQQRVMSFRTRYSLPTYLMAFAVGEFQRSEIQVGKLPVSIVSRRGVGINADHHLKSMAEMMVHFQKRLVPYPFEKYDLVLLPEFAAGGIEHAGITFQAEHRSVDTRIVSDYGLTAHELAHQWFGDLVTVSNWDDLWFKEGLATLLSADAVGAADRSSAAPLDLGGISTVFEEGVASRDTRLSPDQKYNSGPYERSAWNFGQLRARMGEEKFWGFLKSILKKRAFKSVGIKEFTEELRLFASEDLVKDFVRAISAKKVPKISFSRVGNIHTLELNDADGALFNPIELLVLRKGLAPETLHLGGAAPSSVAMDLSNGARVLWDPRNEHPNFLQFVSKESQEAAALFSSSFLQANEKDAPAAFAELSAQSQRNAIAATTTWSPTDYETLVPQLLSVAAKAEILKGVCEKLAAEKPSQLEAKEAWAKVLKNDLVNPPVTGSRLRSLGVFQGCAKLLPPETLQYELDKNLSSLLAHDADPVTLAQIAVLRTLTPETLEFFKTLALNSKSMRAKSNSLDFINNAQNVSADLEPSRREAITQVFEQNFTLEMLRNMWRPAGDWMDARRVVSTTLAMMSDTTAYRVHPRAYCVGKTVARSEELKAFFEDGLPKSDEVDLALRDLLTGTTQCQ